jgi:hypothetical protein
VNPGELTVIRWRVIGFDLNGAPNQILLAGEGICRCCRQFRRSVGERHGAAYSRRGSGGGAGAATKQYVDQIAAGLV